VLFILGWTPRGRATASATALLGLWPGSSTLYGRAPLRCPSSGLHLGRGGIVVITVHLEWGIFTVKYSSWAELYIKYIYMKRNTWV
jgi:hypothetical protein